jgi:hypothetical protein
MNPLFVIVNDLDVGWPTCFFRPFETDAPLPIYANTVLTPAIASKGFKSIAGQIHQILNIRRFGESAQFERGLALECRKLRNALTCGESLSPLVPEKG